MPSLLSSSLIDTSDDLQIYRYGNGIKLINPNRIKSPRKASDLGYSTHTTAGDVLKFPFNVFFLNNSSQIQNANEMTLRTMGFVSLQDALNKTMFDISPKDNAAAVIATDKEVIQTNHIKIVEDDVMHFDGIHQHFLSIKVPIFNLENKTIGILGFAILFGAQSIAHSLLKIANLGILNPNTISENSNNYLLGKTINNIYLTEREHEIIYHIVRGKTAKSIAQVLQISPRTVEQHLENIKFKLKVSSKAELIDLLIA